MDWNAEWYENKHDFVAEYGRGLLSCVPENPDQSILDLGCGTGTLTHALLEKSSSVTGLDSSSEMIAKSPPALSRHGLPRAGRPPHALAQQV